MTLVARQRTHRLLAIVAMTFVVGLVSGCDGQTDPGVAVRGFLIGFARSALAAYLL